MATHALLSEHDTSQNYGSIAANENKQFIDKKQRASSSSYARASWWSKLFFSYANPVMEVGNARQLNHDDLWELDGESKTTVAFETFKAQYARHDKSVERALLATYGWDFFVCGLGWLVIAACSVFAPVVLRHVIDAFSAPEMNTDDLVVWLGAFFVSRLVNTFLSAHLNFRLQNVLIRLTVSLKCLLFEKAMKRSVNSKSVPDAVDISNLFTADMDNIVWSGTQLNAVWIMPIQIVAILYLLYLVLDLAVLAGVGVIVVTLVLNLVVSKGFINAYEEVAGVKDSRMKSVKEVFGAIQTVKLYAWEAKFLEKIRSWRAKEMKLIARYMYIVQFAMFLFFMTPMCVSVASFAVYALAMKKTLTASKVFTSMVLFGSIRSPLSNLPEAIQTLVQARISLRRIETFLSMEEVGSSCVSHDAREYPDDVVVCMKQTSISWSSSTTSDSKPSHSFPGLSNISLEFKRGDFVVIHGAVGTGKSSLCSALLGEVSITSGSIFVRGNSIAYYSQQPWVQNMTLRDNILFGQTFHAEKYARVLDACGLLPDLQEYPVGDQTEIGQKGVNLSGGQKARLCLARACYSDADIYILDSPLAAVDAVVQNEIFNKCLCGILAMKTIVLVTHNPEIITSEAVDVKVLVADGSVTFTRLHRNERDRSRDDLKNRISSTACDAGAQGAKRSDNGQTNPGKLIEVEERAEGRVSKGIFTLYFKALGGVPHMMVLILILVTAQGFQVASDFWLSLWTGKMNHEADQQASVQTNFEIYGALGLSTAVFVLLRSLMIAYVGLRASRFLFDVMTMSLLQAPLRFFDANPIGRIINRYSDDISSIDIELSFNLGCVLVAIITTTFQLATAIYVIQYVGLLLVPLAVVYVWTGHIYLMPSREIARLLKVAASPVLSHVSQSEEGVLVLRAFGPRFVQRAIAENFKRIDDNNRVWYADALVNQWFGIRIQLVGCGIVILIVSAVVWLKDVLSPGLVGLAFMYAVSNDEELVYLVRVWARLELSMVSPERILEYASIEPESHDKIVTFEPSETNWPQHGSITFENVVFSYKPGGAPVLKGVSFEIRENEKIGIVGRTGAGKSSLTMALFRINELVAGRILIDGVDISRMNLQTLRSRLSIIPQAPVLFKGSMRAYMDPFGGYDDAAIWTAFEKVGMKDMISSLDNKLDHELSENGENFSVGERQMLCLARALLRRSRVVVMDEATASIDHGTEKKLQEMIAHEFANATVVTIAHRLATVLESDRVLVLENGSVVEFDAPRSLVRNGGVFHELAKEGGYLKQLLE
ncbi:Atp-binding protein, partial [Globisporangium splendens]